MPYRQRQKQKKLDKEKLGILSGQPLLIVSGLQASNQADIFLDRLITALKKLNITVLTLNNFDHLKTVSSQIVEENEKLYEASDMILFLGKGEAIWPNIAKAMKYHVVPICSQSKIPLKNYNPIKQEGNAFLYKNFDEWEIFAAVVRALENYKFPYDWGNIVEGGGDNL